MDENLNSEQNEVLWNLVANPANNGHAHVAELESLVADFPQSGILHALLSHAKGGQNSPNAALYLNPKAVYVLLNSPETLPIIDNSFIVQDQSSAVFHTTPEQTDQCDENSRMQENELMNPVDNQSVLDAEQDTAYEEVAEVPVHNDVSEEKEEEEIEVVDEEQVAYEEHAFKEQSEQGSITENITQDESVAEAPSFELAEPPRGIEDDVYDEIVGIEDISFTRVAKPAPASANTEQNDVIKEPETIHPAVSAPTHEPAPQRDRILNMDDEAEKLIVSNIAATDYFRFDRAFSEGKQADANEPGSTDHNQNKATGIQLAPAPANNDVSKYDDETLPYTFMWWLNKTRKEHASTYQPFKLDVSQAIRHAGADELQQQYYENIFHLSSVDDLNKSTPQNPLEFDPKSKEDRIIKKFIVEEPHIGAPSSDKLDNENKAKKSAEDHDELVTETLARIYIDQMLYHKAINTYKKLMLKFPEKSRYFADQVDQLQRKTN